MSVSSSVDRKIVIAAGADLHGELPEVPACDLLALVGDLVPYAIESDPEATRQWFAGEFTEWLADAPAVEVVAIAGNHDFWGPEIGPGVFPGLFGARWTYLCDAGMESAGGLSLYGSPWTPDVYDSAFEAPAAELERRFAAIPDGLDLLLVHCPPRGHGDHLANGPGQEPTLMGSTLLSAAITRARPRLVLYGHAHEGFGYRSEEPPGTQLANVTVRTDYTGGRHRMSTFTLETR